MLARPLSHRYLSLLCPMSTLSTRPLNWKAAAPAPLPGTITFAAQPSLPKLPVPELPVTLTRLKEALKPLAKSEAEYATTVAKIDAFGRGVGNELQNRLLKRSAESKHWLEEWWDDLAYLGYRDSVCTSPPTPSLRVLIDT
jgi:carnitine O-acetyltransferase